MRSLEEISDRLDIQQLLVDYSAAIDGHRFDDLDALFTPDAYVDYRATGGIDGTFAEVKTWLAEVLPTYFEVTSHMLGLPALHLDGDTATGRTFCFNPMVLKGEQPTLMQVGVWYDDEFVRTTGGWRIRRRVEQKCYDKMF